MRQEHLIDQHKTKAELITELAELRQEVSRLRARTEDASNVTGHISTEQALRKSEAINRALFEAMPDLVIRLHRNGDYLDFHVPRGFKAINPADETIGKNVYELLPAEIAQQRIQQIERALQTGEVQVAEYQLNLAHGIQYEEARIVPAGDDEVLAIIRDITERKQAEQVILDQQELVGKIIDVLPVGVIVKDVQNDYRFTIWNSKMEEMFGVKREELLGKTDYDHSPREQADFYRQTDMAVMADGQMIDVPVEEITTVQGARLAHTVKLPIFDNQGQPQFLLAVLEDITERKQAELERERLLAEVQRLAAIVENHPDFISIGSLDARVLYINPAGLKMLGLPPDCDVTTLDMRQFFAQDDDTERMFRAGVQTAFAHGSWSTELILTRVDGSKVPVEETISINRDANGKPYSLSITIRDITERKQAAEELLKRTSELEESRNFLDSIIENLPVMLFIKEAKELRHVRWNKAGLELVGRKLEDMVGKNDYDFFPKEEADFFAAKDRETLNSGQIVDIAEEPIQTTDRGTRWLYTRKVPIHGVDGRPNYLLGISVDITERKYTEELLRASEARNQALLNAIPDLIIRYKQDGTYLDVKPSQEFPTFRSPEEMIGKKLVDMVPPDLAQQRLHYIQLALQTGQTQTYEHNYLRDGQVHSEEIWMVPSGRDEVFVVIRDQTARTQAARTIAQQREILDKIINNLPVGVFAKNVQDDYRFTIWNTKMEEMFGTPRQDILGKNDYDLFTDKEEVDYYRQTDVAVMEGGQVVDIPVEEVTTSRGMILSHTTKLPIYDEQGRPQLLLGVLDDITERKQAEEALKNSVSLLQATLEATADGILVADGKGNVTRVNQRFGEMWRIPKSLIASRDDNQLLGFVLDQLVDPGQFIAKVQELYQQPEAESFDLLYFKDGRIFERYSQPQRSEDSVIGRVWSFRDITERKRAEETLRQNEALLRTVIDSTPDWIFIKDEDHRYRLVNQGYAASMHLSPEDFVGKNDLEIGFPEDIVKGNPAKGIRGFWADDRAVMDSRETKIVPEEPAVLDGQPAWLSTIKVPLCDSQNQVWGVLGFVHNITERKQIEETLRQNEARLAEAADIAQLGYWEFDVQTQMFTFTDQFYVMLRTSAAQEGGYQMPAMQYAQKFVHPDAAYIVGAEIQKAIETTDPNYIGQVDHQIIRADGSDGYILVRYRVLKDEQGRTVKLVGINQDITERKQAEAEREHLLAEIRQALTTADRFRQFVEASAQGIGWADLEGNVIYINPTLCRFFGEAKPEDVYGRPVTLYYPEEVQQRLQTEIFPTIIREGGWSGELPIASKDGRLIPTLNTLFLVRDEHGQPLYLANLLTDITERKEAEETLRASQERLSEALDIANLAYWEFDVVTQTFTFNDQFYALLRTTAKQEGGYLMPAMQYAQRFVHPDDAYLVGATIQESMESVDPNASFQIDHRIIRADGSEGHIVVRFRVIKDEQGRTIKTIGANQDITERKQIEIALQESRQRIDLILQGANLGTWDINLQTNEGFVDQQAVEMLGYSLDEVQPHLSWWGEQTHPDDVQFAREQWNAHIEGKTDFYEAEYRLRTKSGGWKWILDRGRIVEYDKNGPPIRVAGTHLDITERKQAEEAIHESQQQYQQILDAITDMILVKGPKSKIMWANKAFRDYYGMTNEQLQDLIDAPFNEPDYTQQYIKDDAYVFNNGQVLNIPEEPVTRYDNEIRLFHTVKSPIFNTDGQVVMTVGVSRDITERKQAEEILRQNEARLAEATSIAQLGYWELDVQTQILTFTDQLYTLLRTTAAREGSYKMPAMQYAQKFVHPDDAFVVGAEIQKAIETTEPSYAAQAEHRIIRADGSEGYIIVRARAIKDGQGQTVKVVGVNQDITERKQVEEALRTSEIRNRALLTAIPDLIIRLGKDGTYLDVKAAKEFASITPLDHMLGRTIFDMLPPEMAQRQSFYIGQALQTGDIQSYEQQLLREGRQVHEEIRMVPIGNNEVIMMIRDITDRKQAEAQLKEAQERAQTILESVTVPMLISRATDGVMLYANNPLAQMVLMSRDQLIGKQTPDFYVDLTDRAQVIDLVQSQGAVNDYELRLKRSNGEVFWGLLSAREFNFQGEPAIITLLIDITERKQAEAERARLLAEVEAAYRQYVQREWEKFLGEQPEIQRAVYQPAHVTTLPALDKLAHLEQEVLREGKTKTLAPIKANGHSTEATIVAPLSLRGQVIGAVSLQDVDPDRAWTAEEVALVETVSEQLALTVENLRLFEDTQKQATREQITRQIADKMRAAPDMDTIIQTGLTELAKALNLSRAYVKLTAKPEAEHF